MITCKYNRETGDLAASCRTLKEAESLKEYLKENFSPFENPIGLVPESLTCVGGVPNREPYLFEEPVEGGSTQSEGYSVMARLKKTEYDTPEIIKIAMERYFTFIKGCGFEFGFVGEESPLVGTVPRTGVTGSYDPESGYLRIFSPDLVSEEVLRNLNQYFPGVWVDAGKGDRNVHSQFAMHLDPDVYSGGVVQKCLSDLGYDVRLPGEELEQDSLVVVEQNKDSPFALRDLVPIID